MVNRYIDEGVAELVPGVLFIDEVSISILAFPGIFPGKCIFLCISGSHAGHGMLFIPESGIRELFVTDCDICNQSRNMQCKVCNPRSLIAKGSHWWQECMAWPFVPTMHVIIMQLDCTMVMILWHQIKSDIRESGLIKKIYLDRGIIGTALLHGHIREFFQ